MYYLVKKGIYDHGVFWIGNDLDEGIAEAKKAHELDSDGYHAWEVRKLEPVKNYQTDKDDPVVFMTHDPEI